MDHHLEAIEDSIEPKHPLQILVDQLTLENVKLKEEVEALKFMNDQKSQKIAQYESEREHISFDNSVSSSSISPSIYETSLKREVLSQASQHTFDESEREHGTLGVSSSSSTSCSIYETPVKTESASQHTLDERERERRHYILKNKIKEAIAELQEKRRRRKWITYLIVDENGVGKYSGMTVQQLKARLIQHNDPSAMITSINLKDWIAKQTHLKAYVIYEGSYEECALVEALLINLGPKLGFDLLNERKEKSRTKTPTKLIPLDDDGEIFVYSETLPMDEEDERHNGFVTDVRNMVEKAMDQEPVRYYRNEVLLDNINARALFYCAKKRRSTEAANINLDDFDTENEEPVMKHAKKVNESETKYEEKNPKVASPRVNLQADDFDIVNEEPETRPSTETFETEDNEVMVIKTKSFQSGHITPTRVKPGYLVSEHANQQARLSSSVNSSEKSFSIPAPIVVLKRSSNQKCRSFRK